MKPYRTVYRSAFGRPGPLPCQLPVSVHCGCDSSADLATLRGGQRRPADRRYAPRA